jgi:hypothetical protein
VSTVALGTVVVVGTAGFAGYTIYKGGEAVVSGARSVGSSVKKAVKKEPKSIVVSGGTFKVTTEHTIAELYPQVEIVFSEAGFTEFSGYKDALEATAQARTSSSGWATVRLELIEKNVTAVEIRVGEGSLKKSEYLYDQILSKVNANKKGK